MESTAHQLPSRRELRAFRARRVRAARRSGRARWMLGAVVVLGLAVASMVAVPSVQVRAAAAWADTGGPTTVARVSAFLDGEAENLASPSPTSGTIPTVGSAASTPTADGTVDAASVLSSAPPVADPTDAATADPVPAETGATGAVPDDASPDDATASAAAPADALSSAAAPAATAEVVVADPVTVFASALVDATNAERSAVGLAPLAVSSCATEQAVARAGVLVSEGRFEHDPLDPVHVACGGSGVGENLALGYPTPAEMMAGWMASEGHRANILRAYTSVGIGCASGPQGMLCAQVFLS